MQMTGCMHGLGQRVLWDYSHNGGTALSIFLNVRRVPEQNAATTILNEPSLLRFAVFWGHLNCPKGPP